ncbi:MAG: DUF1700 domain-containing protein [Ezakiella sp.]|nr:DUF1700 domain-containing protein [Ezakiella sp.]MDD7471810.1 DUF1700 domain-containing protein [Bacillota bacterium]MDY3923774.1 DUF1700 domain-containing protein [Ezakiella sp.]
MNNPFLNNLKHKLENVGIRNNATKEIIHIYEEYLVSGIRRGKTETELIGNLESEEIIANAFAPDEFIEKEIKQSVAPKKRTFGQIVFNGFILFILNIIIVPVLFTFLGIITAITIMPIVIIVIAIALLLYGTFYLNGLLLPIHPLTRWTLSLGIIGLSILVFIGMIYIYGIFFKGVGAIFKYETKFLRRNK